MLLRLLKVSDQVKPLRYNVGTVTPCYSVSKHRKIASKQMLSISLFIAIAIQQDVKRTPSAYWFPASEGIEKWLPRLADEEPFDTWIADPKPNALTLQFAKGKVKFAGPRSVDTTQNRKWRDATIQFALGKTSPKTWLASTAHLGETFHFLTTSRSPDLFTLTASGPNGLGTYSGRAVFAEVLTCFWPGVPCFYATDLYRTRNFPEDQHYESWILAMNDYDGVMLNIRAENPRLVTQKPRIVRADDKPGMLVFEQQIGKRLFTFFLNNGMKPIALPRSFKTNLAIMPRGLDLDTPGGPYLLGSGTVTMIDPPLE